MRDAEGCAAVVRNEHLPELIRSDERDASSVARGVGGLTRRRVPRAPSRRAWSGPIVAFVPAAQPVGAIGAGTRLPKIMSDAFSAIATTLAFVFAPTRRG